MKDHNDSFGYAGFIYTSIGWTIDVDQARK
jgi:hypothetical protein